MDIGAPRAKGTAETARGHDSKGTGHTLGNRERPARGAGQRGHVRPGQRGVCVGVRRADESRVTRAAT